EDGIRDFHVTGVQTCALPIYYDGKVWGVSSWTTRPRVITPTATLGVVSVQDGSDGLVSPYTYSDMTGSQLRLATNPRGYYRQRRSEERRVGKECGTGGAAKRG